MSTQSKIEWLAGGATWNPIAGCAKVSEGCRNCYAMREAWRLSHNPKLQPNPFAGTIKRESKAPPVWTGTINLLPERLELPLRWRKPRRIFVCSMADPFHEAVPDEFLDRMFAVMALAPQHTFMLLTKRPERMQRYIAQHRQGDTVRPDLWTSLRDKAVLIQEVAFIDWPLPNVHLYVSAEDQSTANERIPLLLQTPAAVRGVSLEPLLGPVTLGRIEYVAQKPGSIRAGIHVDALMGRFFESGMPENRLDHIIVGGESGAGARPMHPEWVRSLRDQCAAADVPFFFKQWGEWGRCERFCLPHPLPHYADLAMIRLPDGTELHASAAWVDPHHGRIRALDLSEIVARVGKKAAGRELDGRTHDDLPEPRP